MNADVELLLIPWLISTLNVRAVTDLPENLADVLPLVQVTRIGGPDNDDNPRFDTPTVDIDCFGVDRGAASGLAGRVHAALRVTLPGLQVAGATVTQVLTVTGPSWRPYDNTELRRFSSTYRLFVKS